MSIAPGWYRDPTGRDGDGRWWDGVGWTGDHLARESLEAGTVLPPLPGGSYIASTPAFEQGAAYEVVTPTSNVGNPLTRSVTSSYTAPVVEPPADETAQKRPNRRPILYSIGAIGAVGLVILLLVITGVFTAKNPTQPGTTAIPSGSIPTAGTPTNPATHTIWIVDKKAGIQYSYLGTGWEDYTLGDEPELQSTTGEYIVTQKTTPGGGTFIAEVTTGLLSTAQFGAAPQSSWQSTIEAVKTSVTQNYYPQPNKTKNFEEKSTTIDNHPAYILGFDLTWKVAGYDATGERAVLLLIDTGKSAPALMYCSFPDTEAELYPFIDQVIASIQVTG